MVNQKYYDVALAALTLACEELSRSNIENEEILNFKIHGSLVGYFLMKAQDALYGSE